MAQWKCVGLEIWGTVVRVNWSVNLRAIERCICSLRCIQRKVRSILRTVHAYCRVLGCLSLRRSWVPPPPPSDCSPPLDPNGLGPTLACKLGVGRTQFGRLDRKPGTSAYSEGRLFKTYFSLLKTFQINMCFI